MGSDARRAALIATAVTVPLIIVIALVIGGSSGSPSPSASGTGPAALPAVSVPAPASSDDSTISTCAQLISALPLTLDGQDVRRTTSDPPSSSIVAWGDPPIVLRCGVARPAALTPALTDQFIEVDGVLFLPKRGSATTVWTAVDRKVFLDVTVPNSYAQPPLGPIADAIAKVLPRPVCDQSPSEADRSKLCTRRA